MSNAERKKLRKHLKQWRLPSKQVDQILRHAVFGPGAVRLDFDQQDRGIGIMVDESRDPELAGLFDWRARLDVNEFAFEWQTNAMPRAYGLLCPDAPEAIYAYNVEVLRPVKLTRTYLLLASKQARILAYLREPGTTIWLVPQAVAWREWAKEGLGTADDVFSRALPVGQVNTRPVHLDTVLRHIGFSEA
jgi:hypothetical protein